MSIVRYFFKSFTLIFIFSLMPVFPMINPTNLKQNLKSAGSDNEKLEYLLKLEKYYFNSKDFDTASTYRKQALDMVDKDHSLIKTYDQRRILIHYFQEEAEHGKAVLLCDEGYATVDKEGNSKQQCFYLEQKGYSLWQMNKLDKALEAYSESLAIHRAKQIKENLTTVLSNMGMIYNDLNIHDLALTKLFESLGEMDESNPDFGRTLNSIGVTYFRMGNYENAQHYYNKALEAAENQNYTTQKTDILNNLGVLCQSMKQYEQAEAYYNQSIEYYGKENDKLGICDGLNNLGEIKSAMGDQATALKCFEDSMKIAEECNDTWRTSDSLRNIAAIHRKMGHEKDAEFFIEKSLETGRQVQSRMLLRDIYQEMALIYEKSQKLSKALKAMKEYKHINEELVNEASVRSAMEFDVKYQAEKSAKEIELLKKEKQLQKTINRGMVFAVLGVMALLILVYRNYRIKLKANETIRLKNIALAEAKEELDRLSRTDTLTGLPNRRDMMERILAEKNRYERSLKVFSIILADIDFFKTFNDNYGHDCGDYVLKSVSDILSHSLRKQDSICRWGGEEFLFLLPQTSKEGAASLAEKLREKVELHQFDYNGQPLKITMTFGVSDYHPEQIEPCINDADKALYQGKESGRNCVVMS